MQVHIPIPITHAVERIWFHRLEPIVVPYRKPLAIYAPDRRLSSLAPCDRR